MNKISQDEEGPPEENKIIQTHYALWDNDIMRFSISNIISSPLGIRMTRPLLEEVQISLTALKFPQMNARVSLIALRHTVKQPTLIKISAIGTSCGIFGIGCMICIVLASLVNSVIWLGRIFPVTVSKKYSYACCRSCRGLFLHLESGARPENQQPKHRTAQTKIERIVRRAWGPADEPGGQN
jgi:hypothetical protein